MKHWAECNCYLWRWRYRFIVTECILIVLIMPNCGHFWPASCRPMFLRFLYLVFTVGYPNQNQSLCILWHYIGESDEVLRSELFYKSTKIPCVVMCRLWSPYMHFRCKSATTMLTLNVKGAYRKGPIHREKWPTHSWQQNCATMARSAVNDIERNTCVMRKVHSPHFPTTCWTRSYWNSEPPFNILFDTCLRLASLPRCRSNSVLRTC